MKRFHNACVIINKVFNVSVWKMSTVISVLFIFFVMCFRQLYKNIVCRLHAILCFYGVCRVEKLREGDEINSYTIFYR